MIVDHIGGASWLYALTGGNRFFVSAAEGFIFLSGLVVGIAYRRLIERDGLGAALRRVLERAAALYLVTVGLTLTFLPVSEMLLLPWVQGLDLGDAGAFVVSVLLLHQTYYIVDIPLLYTLLLLVTPLALILLAQGGTRVVLAASWTLWAAYQLFPEQADVPWPIAGNYAFHFSAWQVLFFTALVLGFHRERISAATRSIPRWPVLLGATVLFAGLIALYQSDGAVWRALPLDDPASLDPTEIVLALFGKGDLRPGRLLAFVVVAAFAYLLVDRCWRLLNAVLGWLLLPLGRHALYAYSLHVVFVAVLAILLPPLALADGLARTVYAVIQLALVGLTWLMIRGRVFLPERPDWRVAIGVPAVAAAACLFLLPLESVGIVPAWSTREVEAAGVGDPRVARAFGTPVPRADGRPPPFVAREPFLRRPVAAPAAPGRPSDRVSPYVGAIRGTFRQAVFYTSALDQEYPYYVYLPPDYDTAGRRYPVLYLLHGAAGSAEEWLAYGFVDKLDAMIVALEAQPMIVVLPEGEYSYWVNHVDGLPWGDYVARNLVRHVDATYRTLPATGRRGTGGVSMGGHGALQLTLNYPHVFGVVGMHSPSLRDDDGEVPFLGQGDEWAQRDPVARAEAIPRLSQLKVWIDVGTDDVYFDRVAELRDVLVARGAEVLWRAQTGRDHGDWQDYVESYIRFYDYALNGR
jgi:enterochelin esterase-like enzyme